VRAALNGRRTIYNPTDTAQLYYTAAIAGGADYFPFGAEMRTSTAAGAQRYRYGFNGKELDKNGEFGVMNHYDYGFRVYNPGIGRFLGVDPIAKEYPWVSPYNYAENKVPNAIDLWGLQAFEINQEMNTINISANIIYNKNSSLSKFLNDASYQDKKTLLELASQQFPTSTIFVGDKEWTVSFNVHFKGVDTNQDIVDIISTDITGISVGLVSTSDGSNYYANEAKTIVITSERGDGTTIAHESGHFLGLPHSAYIEGSPYYGRTEKEEDLANTSGIVPGPLMSYDSQRKLQAYEVGYLAKHAVLIANGKNITLTNYYSATFKDAYGLMPVTQYQQLLIYRTPQIQAAFNSLKIKN
jgi:RHS repeat-associated protein